MEYEAAPWSLPLVRFQEGENRLASGLGANWEGSAFPGGLRPG